MRGSDGCDVRGVECGVWQDVVRCGGGTKDKCNVIGVREPLVGRLHLLDTGTRQKCRPNEIE